MNDYPDIRKVAERFRQEDRERERRNSERYALACREFDALVTCASSHSSVKRIRTWGSILRRDRFTDISDIDLCIEGVSDPREWSELERELLDIATLPLDLVRWEELIAFHRESILARGKVVYESGE